MVTDVIESQLCSTSPVFQRVLVLYEFVDFCFAQANLKLLLDPYVLLGMLALLPMLEAVDTLIQWAQKQDAFICDFVGALGVC